MKYRKRISAAFAAAMMLSTCPAIAGDSRPATPAPQTGTKPWMNKSFSAAERTALLLKEMTQDEMFALISGDPGFAFLGSQVPKEAVGSAGYVTGIARLGIPALQETDASLGIANPMKVRPKDFATPLLSGLATAAGFDPETAYEGGALIGREAWRQGFNVLLAGGVNLARDPRNGRNFEYLGEDPLLAGTLAGESIAGIQKQNVISTIKHFAMNDQETKRFWANSVIDEAAMRESDLLAFEIAIEKGKPGSVMCSYNLVNGAYGCGNDPLLNGILKGDWKWPGFVMSDWGAVHDSAYAMAGLDQQSAAAFDKKPYFREPLRAELAKGTFTAERLKDMAGRILYAMFDVGVFDNPPVRSEIDYKAHADIARRIAERGIVLLKNEGGALPLAASAKKIAVIGGYAADGVMSGGGSSQVIGEGRNLEVALSGGGSFGRTMVLHASSPLEAIKKAAPGAEVRYDDGRYTGSAKKLAEWADVVIVFGAQWMSEGADAPDLSLPDRQDALIEAVASANRKTIVVLETGGPVLMPWLGKTAAVLEAWYPGARGGEAIANVLFGKVNPSGRLPVTFPKSIEQNPRPVIPGSDVPEPGMPIGADAPTLKPIDVVYSEGADVGYRWFAKKKLTPLFPFGYGLSYTTFDYKNLKVDGGKTLTVRFDITNTGKVEGADVPQVYLTATPDKPVQRLVGFKRVELKPGETRQVTVTVDPRLLADYDTAGHGWRIKAGAFKVGVAHAATAATLESTAAVEGTFIKP